MYSTNSNLTKFVCNNIGFNFNIHFVKTMQRKGKIYVKGTCGKQSEFLLLKSVCNKAGYIYKGL